MPNFDSRIDAYIARSAPFARPILTHLRGVIHAACPEVVETLKWNAPSFEYHGILCGFAAFKAHAAFGFWKGALVTGDKGESPDAMWGFGRITSVKDLPPKRVLAGYIKKAMALNESGAKLPRPLKHKPASALRVPPDLAAALRKNAKARATFAAFSPSARGDYITWITEAKRAETRAQRLATTLEWLAEGKQRNWKYQKGR